MFNDESLDTLRELVIFKGLSNEQLNRVASCGQSARFDNNAIIIEEGQTEHPLYIILEGQVDIFLPKKQKDNLPDRPTRIKLSRLVKGECFGEYSLIDNEPASASVVATCPCTMLKITRKHFREVIDSNDNVAKIIYRNMLKALIKRARKSVEDLNICF